MYFFWTLSKATLSSIILNGIWIEAQYCEVLHKTFSACEKPTIGNAVLTPSTDPIAIGAEYTVTCKAGYKLSGGNKMMCGANGFNQTPFCVGKKRIFVLKI